MDTGTFRILHKDVLEALNEHRLGDAIVTLQSLIKSLGNWPLITQLDSLSDAYAFMLRYMADGVEDAERIKMFQSFLRSAYELADQCHREYNSQHSSLNYYALVRNNDRTIESILSDLEENAQQQLLITYNPESELYKKEKKALLVKRTELQILLFHSVWASSVWNQNTFEVATTLLQSPFISEFEKAYFVSAVTLATLELFDASKVQFLMQVYRQEENLQVRQRALVGFVFVLLTQYERFKQYPDLLASLSLLKSVPSCRRDLTSFQLQLLLALETRKIQKKMQEEIIPTMLRNPHFKPTKFGFEEIDEITSKNEMNPEWKQNDAELKEIERNLGKLAELQAEGADVYMGTFTHLKHYAFFRETANWLLPFTTDHPGIVELFDKTQKGASLLQAFVQSDALCNSDKYSFCFMAMQIPESQREQLQQMMGNMQMSEEELAGRLGQASVLSAEVVRRQYIQDMYRYFNLCSSKGLATDPFKVNLLFVDNPPLRELLADTGSLEQIANFAVKQSAYSMALRVFSVLESVHQLSAENWQKVGFSYQKERQYSQAIEAYEKANIMKPNSRWVLTHLAQCYYLQANYEQALSYYKMVEVMDSEHIQTLYHCGKCLVQLKAYKEALHYFHKIEFLDEADHKASKAVAWCLFLIQEKDRAERYYQRILNDRPLLEDYMNAAHTAWANHNIPLAIERYRYVFGADKSAATIYEKISEDANELLLYGIGSDEIRLMADILSRNI